MILESLLALPRLGAHHWCRRPVRMGGTRSGIAPRACWLAGARRVRNRRDDVWTKPRQR
jgi:hypothetical protein